MITPRHGRPWVYGKVKADCFCSRAAYFRSGYYPIWEYSVGMRKPGLLWAVRLSAHRAHAPINTLFMVAPYLVHRYRTGTRLPSVTYALNTIFSPVHLYFHPLVVIFFSTTRQLSVPSESFPKLPENSPKVTENLLEHSYKPNNLQYPCLEHSGQDYTLPTYTPYAELICLETPIPHI